MFGLGIGTLISGGLKLAQWGAGYLERKQNADVEKYKAQVGAVQGVAAEALKTEAMRYRTWSNVTMSAMGHPIWWVAWMVFVIPVGLYEAMIFYVSTFDRWLNTPGCSIPEIGQIVKQGTVLCEFWVRKVPPAQGAARENIIYFIFGAQAVSGASAGIAQSLSNWLGSRRA